MAEPQQSSPNTTETSRPQSSNQGGRPIMVDDSKALTCYANFCRVTGSPEELIIDFGVNTQPMGQNDRPIDINQRVILNFYTAKRLLQALHVSVQRHEKVFGSIETDIQKRVVETANG